MLKLLLLAGALATVTTMSASAQQSQLPPAQTETELMGLPVYSSDGQKLGEVTQVGNSDGQMAVRAELGETLGIGSRECDYSCRSVRAERRPHRTLNDRGGSQKETFEAVDPTTSYAGFEV